MRAVKVGPKLGQYIRGLHLGCRLGRQVTLFHGAGGEFEGAQAQGVVVEVGGEDEFVSGGLLQEVLEFLTDGFGCADGGDGEAGLDGEFFRIAPKAVHGENRGGGRRGVRRG